MTTDEYWQMFHLIRGDIESAVASNTTYFKIRNMAASDRAILDKFNRAPYFWNLNAYSLQTTFFISLGRLFDKRKDAWSIYDLTEHTIEHIGLFSKASLRERKRAGLGTNGKDPDWLENYVANAWEPTRSDLKNLGDAIVPYADKFHETYQPIRHIYFAHRGKMGADDIVGLFGKTQISDATDIIRFLYTLVFAIWEIHLNGRKPDLSDVQKYDSYVKVLSDDVEKLIRGLA
jgi:hypothetical protein